uniref:Uncharacterized protein n=1 Tax=Ditylenchus dipsaci TaxID=166011 RepID=A0A915DWU4_9BILA
MVEEKEEERAISNKEELPTSIIIKNVPKELFDDVQLKTNFSDMFLQIDPNARIDYLKGFQRVRVVFSKPEHATAAKVTVEHHSFQGNNMKAYFANNIKFIRKAHQDEEGHLALPPLEKQFLISPPTSPPSVEMAPVICDFDLMARLAAFTVEDNYELHEGDNGQPAIIVTPCALPPNTGPVRAEADQVKTVSNDEDDGARTPSEKTAMPHTPRPPLTES